MPKKADERLKMFWNFYGRLPVNHCRLDDHNFFHKSMNTNFFTALILISLSVARSVCAEDDHEKAARIVAQIQRADYEGDQAAMQRGYDDLNSFLENEKLASRVRYW